MVRARPADTIRAAGGGMASAFGLLRQPITSTRPRDEGTYEARAHEPTPDVSWAALRTP